MTSQVRKMLDENIRELINLPFEDVEGQMTAIASSLIGIETIFNQLDERIRKLESR